jgi:hypothetical protein
MRIIPTLIVLLMVACQSAPSNDAAGSAAGADEVTVALDRTTYAKGGMVAMRITSRSRETLGFNQCSSRAVERQDGSHWVPHPEPDRTCTMELQILMPGETQTATTDLPDVLPPGTYRIVVSFGSQGTGPSRTVRAVSPAFRVS